MPVYDPNVSLDPDDPAPVAVADPQHPGLPKIDPSLNMPLPQGNADLVPYRIARTDPGMAQVTTTGYAPRARAPIQPPGGGGMGAPDLGPLYAEAFKRLPVDEALQAVEAANKFVAQRGYMRDIESGKNAAEAFAKWGPMLFKNATGIPEAIDRSVPTPISPYQQAQLKMRQQQLNAPRLHFGSAGEVIQETGAKEQPFKVLRAGEQKPNKEATITVPLNPDNPDGAKITGPANNPEVIAAVKKHEDALAPKPVPVEKSLLQKAKEMFSGAPPEAPKAVKSKADYEALPSGTIYLGKDGKRYKKP